jgi:hypothetical protein
MCSGIKEEKRKKDKKIIRESHKSLIMIKSHTVGKKNPICTKN